MGVSRLTSAPLPFRSVGVVIVLLVMSAAALSAREPTAEAKPVDDTPPSFAGLKSAITCIPGPIGGGRTTSYNLSWDPADDDRTPRKKIV